MVEVTAINKNWQHLLEFVSTHNCHWSRTPNESGGEWGIHQLDPPPHNKLLGPVFSREGPSGVILQSGEQLCTWGNTVEPDMTFSVTKTYLALVAGVAWDQGLISDLDEKVVNSVPGIGFEGEHNAQITWRHMLQFTSEWTGECFGVPDQVDHYRQVSMQPSTSAATKGALRELQTPGTYWEYNDVRINQFALALLHLFKQPLPQVFDQTIMRPMGASHSWRWYGYRNSWVTINGQRVQSVPGGGHWGGGMVISVADQALIGQMMVNHGVHDRVQIVSKEWLDLMRSPCEVAPFYGLFTWLNTNNVISSVASDSSYFALGIGGQLVWHDPEQSFLGVFRWLAEGQNDALFSLVTELMKNS